MTAPKEILVFYDGARLLLALIPKKVGIGYQKTPIGHHPESWHNDLADAVSADVFGLDGHIEVDARGSLEARVEPFAAALNRVFGYAVRHVDAEEFWANHPRGQAPAVASGPKP